MSVLCVSSSRFSFCSRYFSFSFNTANSCSNCCTHNSSSISLFTHCMYMQLNGAVTQEKDYASDTLTEGSSPAIIPCLSTQLFLCCYCAHRNACRCLVTILSPLAQQLRIPPLREIFWYQKQNYLHKSRSRFIFSCNNKQSLFIF